jgi:hypothetical protein
MCPKVNAVQGFNGTGNARPHSGRIRLDSVHMTRMEISIQKVARITTKRFRYCYKFDHVHPADRLTPYDEARLCLYLRLLDAEAEGADWREVARIVLNRDPTGDPERTHLC